MGENENRGVLTRISEWASHPFTGDMTALEWVLWLGLVIVACVMWTRLISHFDA